MLKISEHGNKIDRFSVCFELQGLHLGEKCVSEVLQRCKQRGLQLEQAVIQVTRNTALGQSHDITNE